MQTNQNHKNRIVSLLPSKWAAGAAGMLLATSLLAGCAGGGVAPADATSTPSVDVATPEVDDTEAMTDTEGMGDSESMTDTEGMGDSESMTDTEGMGDSETMTDTEGMGDSESMTDTETMTDTDTITN